MDINEIPIWKFDHVEIKVLRPHCKELKSSVRCNAVVDFGFFTVSDIGISRFADDTLSWSNDFGWSPFNFMLSHIDNPYCEEVTKLAIMIKNELDKKKDIIIEFLDDPYTMPLYIGKKD